MENFLDVTADFEYDFGVEVDSTIFINENFVPILRTIFLAFSDLFSDLTGAEFNEFVNGGFGQSRYTPGANGTAAALQLTPGKFLNFADGVTANFACGEKSEYLQGKFLHRGVDTDTAIVVVILDDEPNYDPIFNSDSENFEDILEADVDGVGYKLITGGPEEYTDFQLPIQYNTTDTPDSAYIYILTFGDSINLAAGNEMYYVFDELIFTDIMLSADDLDRSETISLTPNPVSDFLLINSDNYPISAYKIYDAMGQLMLQNTNDQPLHRNIDVSGLPVGVYYLETKLEDYFGRKKFVKI